MRLRRIFVLAIIAVLLASGCSGTIFKKFTIDETPPNSISLDARQRLIIVTDQGGPLRDNNGNPLQQHRVVCAEPAPDAFMALVASGGADLVFGGKEIGGRGSMAESVGALGQRTQTIQLLRDGLYRACEAYMNGVIDKNDYRRIMAAYDEILITLVAVESLGRPNLKTLPQIGGQATLTQDENAITATADASVSPKPKIENPPTTYTVDAQRLNEIVKDYYCLQLGMKQMFYNEKSKYLSEQVLKALCEDN